MDWELKGKESPKKGDKYKILYYQVLKKIQEAEKFKKKEQKTVPKSNWLVVTANKRRKDSELDEDEIRLK